MSVHVEVGPDEVVWRDFLATGADAAVYADMGPYRFAHGDYERALADPVRLDAPVRDRSALSSLAAGVPREHCEWLELLYIESGGDAFVGENAPTALAGLRAFAQAGNPMPDATAAKWARDVGFLENNVATVVNFVRAARA